MPANSCCQDVASGLSRQTATDNALGVQIMQKVRRARAVAIAKAEDAERLFRLRLLLLCAGATAAFLALPAIF